MASRKYRPLLPPTIRYSSLTIRFFTTSRQTVESGRLFARDHFLDLAKLLLAEKHFLADEEGRRAERAALDGGLGVLDQPRLDIGVLRTRQQFCCIEAGRGQRLDRHFGVIHFLRLNPHVMEGGFDISL